eukprot:TRINITY_DN20574_c0_g2_i10.p1 TRINITY_DN20574_c0_g2~~TRINITY_DN20574_c0_g2_i10.p1  ORF type:complete len:201 (+),score=-28.69 TRINITY_DN20574_c0_g2_i10:491-1093(+)
MQNYLQLFQKFFTCCRLHMIIFIQELLVVVNLFSYYKIFNKSFCIVRFVVATHRNCQFENTTKQIQFSIQFTNCQLTYQFSKFQISFFPSVNIIVFCICVTQSNLYLYDLLCGSFLIHDTHQKIPSKCSYIRRTCILQVCTNACIYTHDASQIIRIMILLVFFQKKNHVQLNIPYFKLHFLESLYSPVRQYLLYFSQKYI